MPDQKTVFLFDVDNTLLDNDHVTADLKRHLQTNVGLDRSQRYWQRFEEIRSELGYADYLGALQRYRFDYPHDPNLLTVSYFLMSYPFANRLFPNPYVHIAFEEDYRKMEQTYGLTSRWQIPWQVTVKGDISPAELLHLRGHFGIPKFDSNGTGAPANN